MEETIKNTNTTEKIYYIDIIVLEYLLNLGSKEAVQEAYGIYSQTITDLIKNTTISYINEQALSDGDKTAFTNLALQQIFPEEEPQTASTIDPRLQKLLETPELEQRIKTVINVVNKSLYEQHQGDLTPENKQKLNDYLRSIEQITKKSIENIKVLGKILNTYKERKKEEDVAIKNQKPVQQQIPVYEVPVQTTEQPTIQAQSQQVEESIQQPVQQPESTPEPAPQPAQTPAQPIQKPEQNPEQSPEQSPSQPQNPPVNFTTT